MIAVIVRQQVQMLQRQRVIVATFLSVLAMTALAGVIGWSSHNTIVRVYDAATQLLAADGQPAPENPFLSKPVLSLLANMSIYVSLVGALLAIVIGHLLVINDTASGIGRLLLSRPLNRLHLVVAKAVAAAIVLGGSLAASAVVAVAALGLVNGAVPALADLGRLGLFYLVSWLYLMVFALVGMVTALMGTRRSLALLGAMSVWLILTFVVPQITSGLHPTASLNPVVDPVSTSQPFFQATAKARPLSIVEQYKLVSGQVLDTASPEPAGTTALRILPMVGALVGLFLMAIRLVARHDFSKETSDE